MAGGRPARPRGRPPGRVGARQTGSSTGNSRGSGRPRGPGRPPGRPRRGSDSTVESVKLGKIKYIPESSFLKAAPSINDWPTFVLDDAVIFRRGPGSKMTVANVCNVNLEGPCIVRGKVEVEDEHRLLCKLLLSTRGCIVSTKELLADKLFSQCAILPKILPTSKFLCARAILLDTARGLRSGRRERLVGMRSIQRGCTKKCTNTCVRASRSTTKS